MLAQVTELRKLLQASKELAGFPLSDALIERFVHYYSLILKWNPRLHLTTLTEPDEFIERHLAESLFLARSIRSEATGFYDIGSGAGVPGIPVALVCPLLSVTLVEAQQRKAIFLETVAAELALTSVKVVSKRFEQLAPLAPGNVIAVRALERLTEMLPALLQFASKADQVLILAGTPLLGQLPENLSDNWKIQVVTLPDAQQRILLNLERST